MRISVFGLGYVGTVGCGCLAELGHAVVGVDVCEAKVDLVRHGKSPVTERDLPDLLQRAVAAGRLTATADPTAAVHKSEVAMISVGTPSTPSGGITTTYLKQVCRQIGEALRPQSQDFFTVMVRSTCLPAVHRELQQMLEQFSGRTIGETLGYVCHPEFLREGAAVRDFFEPPKIVFGASDEPSRAKCGLLYPGIEAPTFFVDPDEAALVKYADNCFHAAKVTFANEIGMLCRQFGVDSHAVMNIFCQDERLNISPRYLTPGAAFGGSCLPKDLRAILDTGRQSALALPMLSGVLESNRTQIDQLLSRILGPERNPVGIVGLAFKEGTDDVRESPMVAVVEQLSGKGHAVRIFDPSLSVESMIGGNRSFALQSIPHLADLLTDNLQEIVVDSQVVVVSHRLAPEAWSGIEWKKNQRVIDLVNIPALHSAPRYEGLYW